MKRGRRSLCVGLGILALTLAASVGIILSLEHHPDFQRFGSPERLPEQNDYDWKSAFYTALDAFHQGIFSSAETELLNIIRTRPGTPEAWQLLGAVYYRTERMNEAERAFRHLLRQQPFNAAGYNNLSQALLRLNRTEEALEMIQQAVELAPRNGTILLNTAALYAREKRDREAIHFLCRALAGGVQPEVIARNSDLNALLNRPELLKLYDEERRANPAGAAASPVPAAEQPPSDVQPDDSGLLTGEDPDVAPSGKE